MEIIYFILGILSVISLWLVIQNNKLVKAKNLNYASITRALEQNQILNKAIENLNWKLRKLNQQMKDDSYKSLSEINENFETLKTDLNALNQQFILQDQEVQSSFRTISQTFQEINIELYQVKTHVENTIS